MKNKYNLLLKEIEKGISVNDIIKFRVIKHRYRYIPTTFSFKLEFDFTKKRN